MVDFKVTRSKKNQSETSITLQEEEVMQILDALEYRNRSICRGEDEVLYLIFKKLYSILRPAGLKYL